MARVCPHCPPWKGCNDLPWYLLPMFRVYESWILQCMLLGIIGCLFLTWLIENGAEKLKEPLTHIVIKLRYDEPTDPRTPERKSGE